MHFMFYIQEGSLKSQRCVINIKTNQNQFGVMCGSVAEWSKALVLGTSHFDGVGSNPTAASFFILFCINPTMVASSNLTTYNCVFFCSLYDFSSSLPQAS